MACNMLSSATSPWTRIFEYLLLSFVPFFESYRKKLWLHYIAYVAGSFPPYYNGTLIASIHGFPKFGESYHYYQLTSWLWRNQNRWYKRAAFLIIVHTTDRLYTQVVVLASHYTCTQSSTVPYLIWVVYHRRSGPSDGGIGFLRLFLASRTTRVRIFNFLCSPRSTKRGVSQWSVLSLLLFNTAMAALRRCFPQC